MALIGNKKGIFFTLMTILILTLFVVSYSYRSDIDVRTSRTSRIESLNNFIFSLEEDLSRRLYVFSFRVLFLMEQEILTSGSYISDVDYLFNESFYAGTFNGEPNELLGDVFLDSLLSSVNRNSEKFNVAVDLVPTSIEFKQVDPWNVRVVWNLTMTVVDVSGLASWVDNRSIVSFVPISHFQDPVYFLNSGGTISNRFIETPFSPIYSGNGDVSNLSQHISNSYYIASDRAPSFLNRLEGNFSPSEHGVESFVNLQKLSVQGISLVEKSNLDYIYFSNLNPLPLCDVGGLGSFRIDQFNSNFYNISC